MNKTVAKWCIILAWCLLAVCVIFKLCGSTVFEQTSLNPRFVEVCEWLQTDGKYVYYAIGFVVSIVSNTFILLASSLTPKPTMKQLIFIESINIPVWFVKFFFPTAGFICECLMFVILPALVSKKWWTGIVGLVINIVFQLASMFIRGQKLEIFADNVIFSIIFSIDYYIMIALYFLYVCYIKSKKEVKA